jgi:hypothetical protein
MSDIQDLEQHIKDAEFLIERRKMAIRLSENHDFRVLFHEGYFKEDAARLVQLAGDPACDPQQRADALEMAKATGHAKRYLSMAIQMGFHAERELPEMHSTLAELRAAEDAGDDNEE